MDSIQKSRALAAELRWELAQPSVDWDKVAHLALEARQKAAALATELEQEMAQSSVDWSKAECLALELGVLARGLIPTSADGIQ
jgi:hypothetical protein